MGNPITITRDKIKIHFQHLSKIIYVSKHRTEVISLLRIEITPLRSLSTTTLAVPQDKAAIPSAIAHSSARSTDEAPTSYIALAKIKLPSEFLIQTPKTCPRAILQNRCITRSMIFLSKQYSSMPQ